MMEAYATEEQQVEAIKRWFNRYGNFLSWGVIIILSIGLGVKYWFHHRTIVARQASDIYETLLVGQARNDNTTLMHQAERLVKEYPRSVYAGLANLMLAKEAVQQQNWGEAERTLRWVLAHTTPEAINALARVRLMRVLMLQNKREEALTLYDESRAGPYLPILAELKGDILMQQQDWAGAREAYKKAFASVPKEGMAGIFLNFKLEELGVKSEADN